MIKGKAITIQAPFRAYGSYQDAADDYASMLSNNPRFRTCFLHTSSSQFAVALARNGYATDPIYAHKLNSIIRAHKLDKYDAKGNGQ
ncbi:glucosaminidase domain-containing protein [Paraburkholderia sp.]|uniref:glucosaminidase domain-containing protein n=1 Tax=Paraburkholderia sp. TaxID=1926495 RepID=UPI0025E38CDC|nr:glucosaminidase domain-containing protein [Paraburkholderia sp.]